MAPWKPSQENTKQDDRLMKGQGVHHQEFGNGSSRGPGKTPGSARVYFKDGEKEVPLEELTLGTGQESLLDKRTDTQTRTQYEDRKYVVTKDDRPFIEWLWNNGNLQISVEKSRADNFRNWYKSITGQYPDGLKGYHAFHSLENDRDWTGRIEFNEKPPEGMVIPKDLVMNPNRVGTSVTMWGINSKPLAKELIEDFGFRIGRQKGHFNPTIDDAPLSVEPEAAPAKTDEIPPEESAKNIETFFQ